MEKMNLETWKPRFKSHYLAVFFLVALAAAAFLTVDNGGGILEDPKVGHVEVEVNEPEETRQSSEDQTIDDLESDSDSGCSLFSGRWIYDKVSYPLYEEGQCSFMLGEYACQKFGRQESKYQGWRWQPHGCDLPRFNGTLLLERLRGKKLIFVGDSLNKNQWTSMLCLIESSLHPSTPKTVTRNGNLFTFVEPEYNATIGFYWSPLLVESNCDDPETHRVKNRILRITSIENHARHWTDADILIFDAFMWWLDHSMTVLWGSFGSSDAIYKRVSNRLRLYEMGLNTWSEWLELNVNRTRTRLFFMSLSPFHFFGETWDGPQNCYNETEPYKEGYRGISTDPEYISAAQSAIEKLETRGVRVEYLNITNLSDLRRDAHSTIYRKFSHPISEEQLANPTSYSDCVHWCLPGVPDIWNQILYSYVINPS